MRQKYFSHKIDTPFGKFDSKQEYERFLFLLDEERRGVIRDLQRQVRFEIIPRLTRTERIQLKTKTKYVERVDEKAAYYTPDFTYWRGEQFFISEVKSKGTMMARDYPLRRKLIKQIISKHNKDAGFEEWVFEETTE